MNEIKLIEKDFLLALERLKAMPPYIGIAMLGQVFNKEDLIKNVEQKTPEGKEWVEMQVEYLHYLVTDRT